MTFTITHTTTRRKVLEAADLDTAVARFADTELSDGVEFPVNLLVRMTARSYVVEVDRCARCGVVAVRTGDWYDDCCPGCADKTFGEDDE